MKRTMMRNALVFRKIFAARNRERGSVLGWIIVLILLAAALVPIIILLSHTISHPHRIIGDPDDSFERQKLYEELKKAQDTDGNRQFPQVEPHSLPDSIKQDGVPHFSETKE